MTKSSQEKRIRGSIDIIDFVRMIALENNTMIIKCEWDDGQDICDRAMHKFCVFTASNSGELEVSDDVLINYLWHEDTEKTNNRIEKLVLSLKETDE